MYSLFCILVALGIPGCSEQQPEASKQETLPAEPEIAISDSLQKLRDNFSLQPGDPAILVSISDQELLLVRNGDVQQTYPISSSAYGTGSKAGSNKTPLGTHIISEKYGKNAAPGAIFRSRGNTGKIATIYTDGTDTDDDLVTTRIMWLQGMEPGLNKGSGIDSHARYIYIHGTPEEGLIGQPASHGCIRMYNRDVIELFEQVPVGTYVEIQE